MTEMRGSAADFGDQVRMTGGDLGRRRLVVGRRAATAAAMNASRQRQPIVGGPGGWNAGEAVRVHGSHQEVARAERPSPVKTRPGAVGAVRRGREPDDEHARLRIAEARHRAAPVDLFSVGGLLLGRDALAVGAEPRRSASTPMICCLTSDSVREA